MGEVRPRHKAILFVLVLFFLTSSFSQNSQETIGDQGRQISDVLCLPSSLGICLGFAQVKGCFGLRPQRLCSQTLHGGYLVCFPPTTKKWDSTKMKDFCPSPIPECTGPSSSVNVTEFSPNKPLSFQSSSQAPGFPFWWGRGWYLQGRGSVWFTSPGTPGRLCPASSPIPHASHCPHHKPYFATVPALNSTVLCGPSAVAAIEITLAACFTLQAWREVLELGQLPALPLGPELWGSVMALSHVRGTFLH